jgi:hypothetical protein
MKAAEKAWAWWWQRNYERLRDAMPGAGYEEVHTVFKQAYIAGWNARHNCIVRVEPLVGGALYAVTKGKVLK